MSSIIIGTLAGILCTLSFLPQVIKIFKTKNTRDISLLTFSIFSVGVLLWFIYGVMINDLPIILTNIVMFILAVLIVIAKIVYK